MPGPQQSLLELVGLELKGAGVLADGVTDVVVEAVLGGRLHLDGDLHLGAGSPELGDDGVGDGARSRSMRTGSNDTRP